MRHFGSSLSKLLLSIATLSMIASAQTRPAAPATVRLYIMDCGTIGALSPALFDLKAEEIKGPADQVTPCYLIVHPRGTLMWDVGQIPDAKFPADGSPAKQGAFVSTKTLTSQLAQIGYK